MIEQCSKSAQRTEGYFAVRDAKFIRLGCHRMSEEVDLDSFLLLPLLDTGSRDKKLMPVIFVLPQGSLSN